MPKNDSSLKIHRFISKTGKNQYLITSGSEAAAIDVSDAYEEVGSTLESMGARLKYLLITHAHASHLQALPDLKNKYGGIFCLHEYEYELFEESSTALVPEQELKDEQKLPLGDVDIEVILTAGHTKGSVSYYVRQAVALFSGSSFLKQGYGKIWGPKSMSLMLFSLKRLSYNIPAETTIYTGSGDLTTMGEEGWVQCLRSV